MVYNFLLARFGFLVLSEEGCWGREGGERGGEVNPENKDKRRASSLEYKK